MRKETVDARDPEMDAQKMELHAVPESLENGQPASNAQPAETSSERLHGSDFSRSAFDGGEAELKADAEAQQHESDPANPIIRISISKKIPSMTCSEWEARSLSFNELCEMLSNPIITKESFADFCEFDRLSKDKTDKQAAKKAAEDKAAAKDHGGFVGGYFKNPHGRRAIENIAARTLWTADCDHCTPECFEAIEGMIPFLASLDTSHSHSKENPHFRITAPLNRECTPEEYKIISIQLNRDLNEEMLDFQMEHDGITDESLLKRFSFTDKSVITDSARIIFWPSHSANGEFVHKKIEGPLIDVDEILEKYAEETKNEKRQREIQHKAVTRSAIQQRSEDSKYIDPCAMNGIEGLFNRAYTIKDVLSIFLSDVYAPTDDPRRYTLISGSSQKGLAILDDRCAYSHHGTDIAGGIALSPFKAVCIHKYGDNKKAAEAALRNDKGVIAQRLKERALANNVQYDEAEFEKTDENDGWKAALKLSAEGDVLGTVSNCEAILSNDPLFRNFARNEMSDRIEITGSVPWEHENDKQNRKTAKGARKRIDWRETDRAHCIVWLDKLYAGFSNQVFDNALKSSTDSRRFHPLREWMDALPEWDKTKRIENLLPNSFKAEKCEYTAAAMRKMLCAVIARTYRPGCEFNYVLVLDGKQGIGKSSFFRWLIGSDYYTDSLSLEDMHGKVGAEKIQGYALAEIAELAGMRKADIEAVKAFITSFSDDYRGAYEHDTARRLRECVLVGTVNGERGYLRDPEGNRRFWTVKCFHEGARIWDSLYDENDRLQIWAEAMDSYRNGEILDMDSPALRAAAERAQRLALESDERQGIIERFLDLPLPSDWKDKTQEQRIEYIQRENHYGEYKRETVCTSEIYFEALEGDAERWNRKTQNELSLIMKRIDGWEQTGDLEYFPIYGRQRVYRRKAVTPASLEENHAEPVQAQPEIAQPRTASAGESESQMDSWQRFESDIPAPAKESQPEELNKYDKITLDFIKAYVYFMDNNGDYKHARDILHMYQASSPEFLKQEFLWSVRKQLESACFEINAAEAEKLRDEIVKTHLANEMYMDRIDADEIPF